MGREWEEAPLQLEEEKEDTLPFKLRWKTVRFSEEQESHKHVTWVRLQK